MTLRSVNGVRLAVEETGQGEPLVLVHGSWDDVRVWAFVDSDLAKSFRVIAYDRRGHTGSEDGAEPGTRQDDEDDLAALIEDHGIEAAHLVANSFGGSIALGLAARRPEVVASLCIHEPPLLSLAQDDPVVAQLGEGVSSVVELIDSGDHETAARNFVEMVLGPGGWEMMSPEERDAMIGNAGTFADEQRDPAWADADLDALAAFDRPVLFTTGDQSPPFFAAVIARLSEAMERAEVRTIAGAGHVPHLTHPEEYVSLVTGFVRGAS